MTAPLRFADHARVVFLTGAGISVASGLRTFRGPGGLYEEPGAAEPNALPALEAWATAAAIARDPVGCWRAHRALARLTGAASPSEGHAAIAAFEDRPDVGRVTVLTQNVDGLHHRAGSRDVVEVHGSLERVRCTRGCSPSRVAPHPERAPDDPPPCPRCGAALRYDIVLFGEALAPATEPAVHAALTHAELFVAVGTSGTVYPAAAYARAARLAGARTVLVNLEPPEDDDHAFDEVVLGRAEELLPRLLRR